MKRQPPNLTWEFTHEIPPIGRHIDFDSDTVLLLGYIPMEKLLENSFDHPSRIEVERVRVIPEGR